MDSRGIYRLKDARVYKPCYYCKRNMLPSDFVSSKDPKVRGLVVSIEHKQPRALGGSNDKENLLVSCQRCNSLRGHLDFDLFFMFARHVIQDYPNLPNILLRSALLKFITRLAELAIKNKKESMSALLFAKKSLEAEIEKSPYTED